MCSKPVALSCKVIIWKNSKGLSSCRLVYAAVLNSSGKPSYLSWAFETDCEATEYGHLHEREGWWVWSKQREWQLNGWAWLIWVAEYADPLKPHGQDWEWQRVKASAVSWRPFIPKFSLFPVSVPLSQDHSRVTMTMLAFPSPRKSP